MKVNIDLDMVAHELGHLRRETGEQDENGEPILELFPFDEVAPIAKGRVLSIVMGSQSGGWRGFLTRGRHYRHELATMLPYKGHREDMARNNVDLIKGLFHTDLGAEWCDDREADDALATEQWQDLVDVGSEHGWDDDTLRQLSNTVIATRDKDLNTVPGWHFIWWLKGGKDRDGNVVPEEKRLVEKGEAYWVTVIEAFRNFYKQMLMGDTADNIKGLYNIGAKSAWVKQLDDINDEEEMYDHVEEKYKKYYGNYADKFIHEVGNLLHMQRRRNDEWLPPHARDEHYWYL
jgi:hypothetical protein